MRTTLKRILKTGLNNFKRNGLVSFVSVLVTTITLSVILLLVFFQAVFSNSLKEVQSKVDMTVYFIQDTSELNILPLKTSLETLPEVKQVTYTSADEALALYKERHTNDELALRALDEVSSNPLGASLKIEAKNSNQYEIIYKFLTGDSEVVSKAKQYIDNINYKKNELVIERLNEIINTGKKLGLLLASILMIIAIVVTFNTIRLTIHYSREEINIMRLVGASKSYIRGPFAVEGMLYGFCGSLMAVIIFLPITYWLGKQMTLFLGINLFSYYMSHFLLIFPSIIFAGIFLGSLSSLFAIRKYLK